MQVSPPMVRTMWRTVRRTTPRFAHGWNMAIGSPEATLPREAIVCLPFELEAKDLTVYKSESHEAVGADIEGAKQGLGLPGTHLDAAGDQSSVDGAPGFHFLLSLCLLGRNGVNMDIRGLFLSRICVHLLFRVVQVGVFVRNDRSLRGCPLVTMRPVLILRCMLGRNRSLLQEPPRS